MVYTVVAVIVVVWSPRSLCLDELLKFSSYSCSSYGSFRNLGIILVTFICILFSLPIKLIK